MLYNLELKLLILCLEECVKGHQRRPRKLVTVFNGGIRWAKISETCMFLNPGTFDLKTMILICLHYRDCCNWWTHLLILHATEKSAEPSSLKAWKKLGVFLLNPRCGSKKLYVNILGHKWFLMINYRLLVFQTRHRHHGGCRISESDKYTDLWSCLFFLVC